MSLLISEVILIMLQQNKNDVKYRALTKKALLSISDKRAFFHYLVMLNDSFERGPS